MFVCTQRIHSRMRLSITFAGGDRHLWHVFVHMNVCVVVTNIYVILQEIRVKNNNILSFRD